MTTSLKNSVSPTLIRSVLLAGLLGSALFLMGKVPGIEPAETMAAGYGAAGVVLYLWLQLVGRASPREAIRRWFGRFTFRSLWIGLLAGVGIFVLAGVGYAVTRAIGDGGAMPGLPDNGLLLVLMALARLVLAPVIEEVAFRGYVLRELLVSLPAWAGIVLSAALFSLYHFDLSQLLPTFLVGLGLAFAMKKSRTLWVPLIAHAGFNSIGFALAFAQGA